MSNSLVLSIFSSATARLSSFIKSFVSPSSGVEKFAELEMMMKTIQSALEDANARQLRSYSDQLRFNELRDIAYHIDDLVDDYNYQVFKLRAESRAKQSVTSSLNFSSKMETYDAVAEPVVMVPFVDGLEHRLKEVKNRFNEMTSVWECLTLPQMEKKRRRIEARAHTETSSFVDESVVVGRDDDKEKIVKLLIQEDGGDEKLSVMAITGMGGIGKTTLAQLVCNDPKVSQSFDLLGWVCVSQDSDVTSLMRKIAVSLLKDQVATNPDTLRLSLEAELRGKRLLLVLDDVWIEDHSVWDKLKSILASASVCKVLITTRNASFAGVMQTSVLIEVGCLSFENSWLLFKKHAFSGRDIQSKENLVEIGAKITERCKGLPLAIKVLAAALHYETDNETWEDILNSELWELDEGEDDILPALRLSYDYMPLDLKQCFMYFSLIPKSGVIDKDQIVQMWISQGFLQPTRGMEMKDIGNEFFKYFLDRSILQEEVAKSYHIFFGDPIFDSKFFMHDLIHDLAQSVSLGVCLGEVVNRPFKIPDKLRHLSLVSTTKEETIDLSLFHESKLLRTVKVTATSGNVVGLENLLRNCALVRALDLTGMNVQELPNSVANFKHLRYLCLEHAMIKRIPECVCNLYHLETLNLVSHYLRELPKGIGNLVNLRHLLMLKGSVCMPNGMGELINLQTLPFFMIGTGSWHCGITELKGLTNLRGELSIFRLQNVLHFADIKREKYLKDMKLLESLQLEWEGPPLPDDCTHCYSDKGNRMQNAVKHSEPLLSECVLESLEPNTNLKRLEISSFNGSKFPRWLTHDSYTNLDTLALSFCTAECKTLPPLGQLPSLRNLIICGMEGVECIGRELSGVEPSAKGFPSLKRLRFQLMPRLVEWLDLNDKDFPCLQKLEIEFCEELRKLPRRLPSSLTDLYIVNSGVRKIPLPPLLEKIYLRECKDLMPFDNLFGLKALKDVEIRDCPLCKTPPVTDFPKMIFLKRIKYRNS